MPHHWLLLGSKGLTCSLLYSCRNFCLISWTCTPCPSWRKILAMPLLNFGNSRWWTAAILRVVKSIAIYQRNIARFWIDIWYTTEQHIWNSTTARRPTGTLIFKIQDGRRYKIVFGHNSAADFSKRLRGEAVFHKISVMVQIPAFHITYFFVFLMQLCHQRAAPFVSSPIHLWINLFV